MDSEYSVMVSNKFAGLLVDEEDPAEIINGPKEKSKDEDINRKDTKKKQNLDKKVAKSSTKDAFAKKENVNDENKKDSKCVYVA
jgi:hypothetical protein